VRSAVTPAFAASALLLLIAQGQSGATGEQPSTPERDWPAVTRETKPWTRWWWHGSAVDRRNLTSELEALRDVGIGGVEVTPIYGIRGEESRFIPFLSDTWVAMLDHVLQDAARLDIGVDMATGTGWPFGGPWVGDDTAPRTLLHKTWTLEQGQALTEPVRYKQDPLLRALGNQIYEVGEIKPGEPPPIGTAQRPQTRSDVHPLQINDIAEPVAANRNLQALAIEQIKYPRELPPIVVVAHSASGPITDLTSRVDARGVLNWTAPERATIYALFSGAHGKLVERAAPGGEGNVIDHFSPTAIRAYLSRFDRAFAYRISGGPRAFFNDSYEVDDATGQGNWTPLLFGEFQQRRGYDLRRHLPALLGQDTSDVNTRVITDYRETISDLLLETFTTEWQTWARRRGSIVRNQAHGSPANLLDLYAASDIPETEGTDIPRFKWATSAANVAGRRLVSAEAATWLGEHFRSTLADVRAAVDHFFVAGVNSIVYHGTAYSPDDALWPGWQFYAAVDFNRRSAWWDDFATLNAYVTRTQSFLQSGRADHDVLLYFPFHEAVATRGSALLTHFGGANRPTAAPGFEAAAATLQSRGFTFDYISDRQLRDVRVEKGRLRTSGGGTYRVLVLPASRFMPIETLEHVLDLASRGATIVLAGNGPSDVPGLASLEVRQQRFRRAIAMLSTAGSAGLHAGTEGVLQGDDLEITLTRAGVARERLVDHGLLFARRIDARGRFYFVSNRTDRVVEGWIPLHSAAAAAMVFDPMNGRRGGAHVRRSEPGTLEVYLQIPQGGSLILAEAARAARERHDFYTTAGAPATVEATWSVRFLKGGPALPAARTIDRLISWTAFEGDDRVRSFSGTARYSTTFAMPEADKADAWQLDLGRVHESARVRLNGRDLGVLIGPAFRLALDPGSLRASNVLEVTVTNLSANRIADLDRRGVIWKKFYNVNMPARLPQNRGGDGLFTASKWEPLDSGLLGPVTLTPVVRVDGGIQ
jgi:alpha-L-rhamnosidase